MTAIARGEAPFQRRGRPFGWLGVLVLLAGAPAQDSVRSYGYQRFDSRLAEPNPSNPIVELAAGTYHTMARRSDDRIVAWGAQNVSRCNTPELPAGT